MTTPKEDMDLSQYKQSRHESSYSKLDAYRKDGTLCDITLKSTDGKEIRVHKCVLVSNSEYFEKMFIGKFQETTQDVVQIKDISSEGLQNLIDFMYTGVLVQINQDNIDEMLFGAELFLMNDVRNECISYYMRSLSDENCLTIKEIADIRAMTKLSEECFNYALKHFNDVVLHQSFLDADVKQLTQLLKSDNLSSREEETVYRAVIKWIKHDEAGRKHLLPGLLRHVRLVFMPKDCLLRETKIEPLIYTNPHCMHCFKKVFNHFNFKYGDSLKKIISNVKPRKNTTNVLTIDEILRLRFHQCTPPPECSKRRGIDLLEYLNDYDFDGNLPHVEWYQYMREDNFLEDWDEEWRGNNNSTDEESDD